MLDLGCGSGPLSAVVSASGYGVFGVDLSASLLERARQRVPVGTFVQKSLFDVEFPPAVGAACVGECLNYLFDPSNSDTALASLFRRVGTALPRNGVFLLDVLTTGCPDDGYRTWTQTDDWSVLVEVQVDAAAHLLTRDITTYRKVGETFRRAHETHRVPLLDPQTLAEALREAGFRFRNLAGYAEIRLRKGHRAYLATKNGCD